LSVVATVGGTLPKGAIYPVIVLDKPIFTIHNIIQSGSATFTTSLTPDVTLAPGTYTGTITLHLYKDSGYSSQYPLTGGDLPYTLTVTPELQITVKIDGVVSTTIKPTSSNTGVMSIFSNTIYWTNSITPASVVTLKAGQVLELESNIPVDWSGAGDFYPYGSMWAPSVKTTTTFQQVVPALPEGVPIMTGNSFIATPVRPAGAGIYSGQYGAGFIIDVTN
jgi:hypothetical protein